LSRHCHPERGSRRTPRSLTAPTGASRLLESNPDWLSGAQAITMRLDGRRNCTDSPSTCHSEERSDEESAFRGRCPILTERPGTLSRHCHPERSSPSRWPLGPRSRRTPRSLTASTGVSRLSASKPDWLSRPKAITMGAERTAQPHRLSLPLVIPRSAATRNLLFPPGAPPLTERPLRR